MEYPIFDTHAHYSARAFDADRFALLPDRETDGDFSGVFYPYGQVAAYTGLPGASFELDEDDLCRWYSDGHDAFYITGSYTLHEDGLAYRQDGPVYAAGFDPVDYDPADGRVRRKETVQGFSDESAWARGQAWALYGYTMMFRLSGYKCYLNQAENIAGMLLERLPDDGTEFKWS